MIVVVLWLLSIGYTMIYVGIARFGGTDITIGKALGLTS